MAQIKLAVSEIEFEDNGNTIWVHSPRGLTILRIKTMGQIVTHKTQGISSHADVITEKNIDIFVVEEDKVSAPSAAPPAP
jgi:hypothetical protein